MQRGITPTTDPARTEAVDAARKRWTEKLIDTSRRNSLLFFNSKRKTGLLDVTKADAEAMRQLLSGEAVPVARLVPDVDPRLSAARALEIRKRAIANLEEKGLQTLFLALGAATWESRDGGSNPQSPVVLVPIAIEPKGRDGRAATIQQAGDPQINLVLAHVLQTEFGVQVDVDALLDAVGSIGTQRGQDNGAFDPEPINQAFRERTIGVKGFAIQQFAFLSNFSFAKLAMVKDLREYGTELAQNDLVAALAGNMPARESIGSSRQEIKADEIDKVPPEQEYFILDADSSQQRATMAVLAGQSGVIQGPPGTGKSQTIVNLITNLTAKGKRVLFVAEKRAALEVVLNRLNRVGLGHLALDLHGADLSRKLVMSKVAASLGAIREVPPVNYDRQHREVSDLRTKLNAQVMSLHRVRSRTGISLFELQGKLLRAPENHRASTRWRGPALDRLTCDVVGSLKSSLEDAYGLNSLMLGNSSSPWAKAKFTDGKNAEIALEAAKWLRTRGIDSLERFTGELATGIGVPGPKDYASADKLLMLVLRANTFLEHYRVEIFKEDLQALERELSPGKPGLLHIWRMVTNSGYRLALSKLQGARIGLKGTVDVLLRDTRRALTLVDEWRAQSAGLPRASDSSVLAQAQTAYGESRTLLVALATDLGENDLATLTFGALRERLGALAGDETAPVQVAFVRNLERQFDQVGAGAFLEELRATQAEPDTWPARLDFAWLTSCYEREKIDEPRLVSFSHAQQDAWVKGFRTADQERLRLAISRVARAHAERAVNAFNTNKEQYNILRREAEKRSRHMPIRKLFAQAPDVLTALFPCWMASPLSVSQLLDGSRPYFDVVLFDEASQILPEDSVAAILRATHAVVAGDKHQLPPTQFFAAGDNDEGDEEENDSLAAVAGYESLLDQMQSFMSPWSLDWHYRSKDESLIAFSNRHIYHDRLITFPSASYLGAVNHVLVAAKPRDAETDSSSEEARKVAELILEHARTRPDRTLGVIALGIKHAKRIEAALDDLRQFDPSLDSFFDEANPEKFFIKNLERVQGDERDEIILSVGYGKDASGKLPYRFGPLLSEGGERRLNVAVTRARYRMTLVSSFDHTDMDPARSRARGVELLRMYFQFAASHGERTGDEIATGFELNAFEADVFDALKEKGLQLVPQLGVSGYRIDIAVQHPDQPGRFVLAIECDGASYQSAPTARDRDRLRQQQLESLGWRFFRIWSTDWFNHREHELARVLTAYEESIGTSPNPSSIGALATPATLLRRAPTAIPFEPIIRSPKPNLIPGGKIGDYSANNLAELARWILSDGKLRTDDEVVALMMSELGFARRGSHIVSTLENAVKRVRLTR